MILLKPIFYFFLYSLLTIVWFFYGPVEYAIKNTQSLSFFLIACHLLLFFGYVFSALKLRVRPRVISYSGKRVNLDFYIKISIIISCTVSLFILFKVTGGDFYQFIYDGLFDPKAAYMKVRGLEKESDLVTQMQTLLSPIVLSSFSLGVFYYKRLGLFFKALLVFSIFIFVLAYIAKGTNFGVFVALIIFISTYAMKKIILNRQGFSSGSFITRVIVYLFLFLFCFYFLYTITSRLGLDSIPSSSSGQPINKEHLYFSLLPDFLSVPLLIGSTYLIQGYYGLSLVFNYNFDFSYGLGIGRFIITKAQPFVDVDIWSTTYQIKMNEAWDADIQWHTSYAWLANAFSVYGVPIYLFFIGVISNLIYKSYLYSRSAISIALFPFYTLMFVFFPANNVIYNNPIVFMPFLVLTTLFFVFTKVTYVKEK